MSSTNMANPLEKKQADISIANISETVSKQFSAVSYAKNTTCHVNNRNEAKY